MTRFESWLRERLNPWSTSMARRWYGGWRRPGSKSFEFRPPGSEGVSGLWGVRLERSPGTWEAPKGERPGWSWLPPSGARAMTRRMPKWARLWYMAPLVDRFAYEWMWWHGYWGIPVEWQGPTPDDGVREPRHPYDPNRSAYMRRDRLESPTVRLTSYSVPRRPSRP